MYFKSDLSSFYFESVLSSYYTQDRRLIVIQNMVLSEYGDAAQTATTWGMRLKAKSTITTPFSPYVLTLFAHSYDLTLMVQHNESRGDKC